MMCVLSHFCTTTYIRDCKVDWSIATALHSTNSIRKYMYGMGQKTNFLKVRNPVKGDIERHSKNTKLFGHYSRVTLVLWTLPPSWPTLYVPKMRSGQIQHRVHNQLGNAITVCFLIRNDTRLPFYCRSATALTVLNANSKRCHLPQHTDPSSHRHQCL